MKNLFNKLTSMVMTTVMFLGITLAAPAFAFPDVQGHWAKANILEMAEKGIIKGKDANWFDPEANITRAEYVAICNRAFPEATMEKARTMNFGDVIVGHWFNEDVHKAANAALIDGRSSTEFDPFASITRQEAAVVTYNYLDKIVFEFTDSTVTVKDMNLVATWAKTAVSKLVQSEIIGGYEDGEFRPINNITRAESATIISRVLKKLADDELLSDIFGLEPGKKQETREMRETRVLTILETLPIKDKNFSFQDGDVMFEGKTTRDLAEYIADIPENIREFFEITWYVDDECTIEWDGKEDVPGGPKGESNVADKHKDLKKLLDGTQSTILVRGTKSGNTSSFRLHQAIPLTQNRTVTLQSYYSDGAFIESASGVYLTTYTYNIRDYYRHFRVNKPIGGSTPTVNLTFVNVQLKGKRPGDIIIQNCYGGITNGYFDGVSYYAAGNLELTGANTIPNFKNIYNCNTDTNNKEAAKRKSGGGIFNGPNGELKLYGNFKIANNDATKGGGIHNNGGGVEMHDEVSISFNNSNYLHDTYNGGGVFNENSGTLIMYDNAMINGNRADNGGGVRNTSYFEMNGHSQVIGNIAGAGGGVHNQGNDAGILIHGNASVSLNEVASWVGSGSGGGIYNNSNAKLFVKGRAVISQNKALNGGGIYNTTSGGEINLSDFAQIYNNTATNNGGGIAASVLSSVSATSGVTFAGNKAATAWIMTAPADITLHNQKIKTTAISPPKSVFQYAYNNYDINYTKGTLWNGATPTPTPKPTLNPIFLTAVPNPPGNQIK